MKDKRMITPFEKLMLEKRAYADSLSKATPDAMDLVKDLPQSPAIKASEAGADFAEKRGKQLMSKAATEGASLRKGALSNLAKKLGGKGIGRVAGLAAGPIGLLLSGAAEAADSPSAGPEEGSRDSDIEARGLSKEDIEAGNAELLRQSREAEEKADFERRHKERVQKGKLLSEKAKEEGYLPHVRENLAMEDKIEEMYPTDMSEENIERNKEKMKMRHLINMIKGSR